MVDRVDVKLGWSCNNRCRFCVQGDKRHRFPDRTTDEALLLLEEARGAADQVVLTGGEVTLRPDLPRLVRHARALGFVVIQIQTNGRLLADERLCDTLLEAGTTEFSPALHAPRPAAHDYLTRAEGAFRETVRGIVNLRRRGARVLTNSVITRSTYRLLPEIGRLLVRLGVDQYQLAFPHPLGGAAESFASIVPRLSIIEPYVKAGLEPGLLAGVRVMTEAIPLCFLVGYEEHAAELQMPRTRILDATGIIPDYTEHRLAEGKAKGPQCAGCPLGSRCEGAWREYGERLGWGELARPGRIPTPSPVR